MTVADLLTKVSRIETEIHAVLHKMDRIYNSQFALWVQDPQNVYEVAKHLSGMIQEYNRTKQIAVIRYCTRQYSIKEIANLFKSIDVNIDMSQILDGLTILWHAERKKELLIYLNAN
eukprot:NODE_134_length_18141_cov_0.186066.p11 type:complete len:117 gc:universal NODE_134_length_18141_cov_0.186066:682-1032(+)